MLSRLLPSFLPVPEPALVHAHHKYDRHLTKAGDCAKRLQPITKRSFRGQGAHMAQVTANDYPATSSTSAKALREDLLGTQGTDSHALGDLPDRESPLASSKTPSRSFGPIRLPCDIGPSRSESASSKWQPRRRSLRTSPKRPAARGHCCLLDLVGAGSPRGRDQVLAVMPCPLPCWPCLSRAICSGAAAADPVSHTRKG
jgi:hypothetical protein